MAFYTKNEARQASQRTVYKSYPRKTSTQILGESFQKALDTDTYDVFLSHSINDAEIILGVKTLLEDHGLAVYVDWYVDPQLSRDKVNTETAYILRKRMGQSKSLIYVATDNASGSKWMPWELGYFDGLRNGRVAILPLVDSPGSSFKGQEYLGLYPIVEKGSYDNGIEDVFVEDRPSRWMTLKNFSKGGTWNRYKTN